MVNQIRVLLLFPPVWSPSAPYLSLPVLTSYLNTHGISAIQRDWNISYWNDLTSSEKVAETYTKLLEKWETLGLRPCLSHYEESLQIAIAGVKELGLARFVSEVQDGTIDKELFRQIAHG